MSDPVRQPQHYMKHPSGIEIIDITRHHSFTIGNALKYLARHEHKGAPVEDLRKAMAYLQFQIDYLEYDEWRTFPLDDRYEVSTQGKVRNALTKAERRLVPIPNGYLTFMVTRGSERRLYYVHRAVAETFIMPIPKGMVVCHKDGNKANNAISNLRIDTQKANMRDKRRHGTHLSGERMPWASLTNEDAAVIRTRLAAGESRKALALEYGVGRGVIQRIARGETYVDRRTQQDLNEERFLEHEPPGNIRNAYELIFRADHKGKPVEDLKKARWYLDREISRREREDQS